MAGAVVVAVVVATDGAQRGGGQPCTLIGASSGLRVDLRAYASAPAGWTGEVCLAEQCRPLPLLGEPPVPAVSVDLPLREGKAVELIVRTRDAAGALLAESAVRVRPRRYEPNGPGCDPRVAIAAIALDRTGRAQAA